MTDRHTAETTTAQWLLTVWQTRQASREGGTAIRVCTGQSVDSGGYRYEARLDPGFAVTKALTVGATTVSVRFGWDEDYPIAPADFPLEDGWAELAMLNEGGAADTSVGVVGRVVNPTWGKTIDAITLSIVRDAPDLDKDLLYKAERQITSARSVDVDNTDDADRAPNSDGAWPTVVYASERIAATHFLTPAYVMFDEVIAQHTSNTDLTGRHWIVCDGNLHNSSGNRKIRLAASTGGSTLYGQPYTVSVTEALDSANLRYTYVDGGEQMAEVLGYDITTTNASTTVTAAANNSFHSGMSVHDQLRRETDADDEWDRVESIDSDTQITLAGIHGTTGTSSGERIKSPANQPVGAWFDPNSLGGVAGPWRDGPLFHAVELLERVLSKSDLGGARLHVGDVRAIGAQMPGLDIHTASVDNPAAFPWIAAGVLSILPIVPYLEGDWLRWYLDPVISDVLPILTLDLDTQEDIAMEGGVSRDLGEKLSSVRLSHRWDLRLQKYRSVVVVDKTNNRRAGAVHYASGQVADLREATPQAPLFNAKQPAYIAAAWRLLMGARRRRFVLVGGPAYRYLRRLDVISVKEAGSLPIATLVRLMAVTRTGSGQVRLICEELVR